MLFFPLIFFKGFSRSPALTPLDISYFVTKVSSGDGLFLFEISSLLLQDI